MQASARRLLGLTGIGLASLWLALWWQPVRSTPVRAGLVLLVALLLSGLISTTWRWHRAGPLLLGLSLNLLLWAAATTRPVPPPADRFSAALRRYAGVPYVWGGETGRGIDCSGLIRQALVDCHLHAGRLGLAGSIWWRDQAAADLGAAPCWRPVGRCTSIGAVPTTPAGVLLAVTVDGSHVLARLDDGRWIQASPGAGKVVIKAAQEPDPWHALPVQVFRLRRE